MYIFVCACVCAHVDVISTYRYVADVTHVGEQTGSQASIAALRISRFS